MITNDRTNPSLRAAVAACALLAVCAQARAQKPNHVSSPPHPVIVENTDPIPVEGDVSATIDGTVPVLVENTDPIDVEGSVLVINPDPIPIVGHVNADVTGTVEVEDFDTRMAALERKVEEVRDAVQAQQVPERVPWTWASDRRVLGPIEYVCMEPPSGNWEDTEFLMVSSENDSIQVVLHRYRGCNGNSMIRFGANARDFPTVQPINFPRPITFGSLSISCENTLESCEVIVSMIGSHPAP